MQEYTLKPTAELKRLALREGTTPEKIIHFVLLTLKNLGYYVEDEEEGKTIKEIVSSIFDASVIVAAATSGYTTTKLRIIRKLKVIKK